MNTTGRLFRVTVFGESHGPLIGVVVDGCPAGLPLEEPFIQKELNRRRPGTSGLVSPRQEPDCVEIASGLFRGKTSGGPIAMLIRNRDADPASYQKIARLLRPGHADFAARKKYGESFDFRGGGIFSGRLTAAMVMAGAVARRILQEHRATVFAHTVQVGKVAVPPDLPARTTEQVVRSGGPIDRLAKNREKTPVRCAHLPTAARMVRAIERAQRRGDSLGGVVECIARGLPAGIGGPFWGSVEGELSRVVFGIPAAKGIEFGAGFQAARMAGSEHNDAYRIRRGRIEPASNRAGGILGGLTTGMAVVFRVAFKPPSSIRAEQKTVDWRSGRPGSLRLEGRYDPCIVPRAVPVVEAAAAMVFADLLLLSDGERKAKSKKRKTKS